jgi:predicted integral membrane protein DUF2269
MIATITGFGIGLFIHVAAVVLAFGPTFSYPIFVGIAEESSPRSVPTILRAILRIDRLLVNPGLVVVVLAGIYLLIDGDISAGESWVGVGIAAVVILFGMAHGFFRPNIDRALEIAERDLARSDELSPEYLQLSSKIATGGKIAGAIVVVTIFFMAVQP